MSIRTLFGVPAAFALAAALGTSFAHAATHYVRSDGGTAAQCDGTVDAAYVAGGNGHCAWKHPFIALPPHGSSAPARIAGGDTLIVGPGDYRIGVGAPGAEDCSAVFSRECYLDKIPSGPSVAQPTRLLGAGHDQGCSNPPKLRGTGRVSQVMKLATVQNVEIACFDVSDNSECIAGHCPCNTGSSACGSGTLACPLASEVAACTVTGDGSEPWAYLGLYAEDAAHVTLRHIALHGFAVSGFKGGRLRDWTIEDTRIDHNGWSGWDGDIGADGASSNTGILAFRRVEIAWNGCSERIPSGQTFGCWGQRTGGYGDGLGTHQTGGTWLIEDSIIHHNTSDGLDLLYADGVNSQIIVRRTRAFSNAGNQLKTKGPALLENNVVSGDCATFDGRHNMTRSDHCRAMGNALSITTTANDVVNLRHNSVVSQGDCVLVSNGETDANGAPTDAGAALWLQNNLFHGQPDYTADPPGSQRSCGHYAMATAGSQHYVRNAFWNVKNGQCPTDSVCSDPRITDATLAAFDPRPLATSPLIDAAAMTGSAVSAEDFFRTPRPQGPASDIGAIELRGDVIFRDGFDTP